MLKPFVRVASEDWARRRQLGNRSVHKVREDCQVVGNKAQSSAAAHKRFLAVGCIGCSIPRNLRLDRIAMREQHFFGVNQIAAFLAVIIEFARFDD